MHGGERITPTWLGYVLGALCVATIVAAVLVVGPAGSPARARLVTATRGVVQSTVSATGTVEGATEETVNFKTGGQLQDVYVHVGQRVHAGQLLAQLDPTQATLNVDQAQANLSAAEARLAQAAASPATSSSGSASSGGGSSSTGASASTSSSTPQLQPAAFVRKPATKKPSKPSQPNTTQGPTTSTQGPASTGSSGGASAANPQATAAAIAAAQASVDSAQVAVDSSQNTLNDTKLYAPAAGTVESISAQPGETVGGGGSSPTAAAGAPSSSSGSGGQGGGSGQAPGAAAAASDGGSAGSSSSSSTGFIQLVDTSGFQLQVPVGESDISKLRVGQPATVTVNALPGDELAAHVASIASLPTTNGGVVSYMVTFALDQSDPALRPGMTASAQVVVSQISGAVTVPSSAISRRGATVTVTVMRAGKASTAAIVTGMAGDSSTQVISGVTPGEQIELPLPTTTGTSTRGVAGGGALGGGAGGLGALGGGRLGGGGGGARFGGGGG